MEAFSLKELYCSDKPDCFSIHRVLLKPVNGPSGNPVFLISTAFFPGPVPQKETHGQFSAHLTILQSSQPYCFLHNSISFFALLTGSNRIIGLNRSRHCASVGPYEKLVSMKTLPLKRGVRSGDLRNGTARVNISPAGFRSGFQRMDTGTIFMGNFVLRLY